MDLTVPPEDLIVSPPRNGYDHDLSLVDCNI
jgi:hypothetical protein